MLGHEALLRHEVRFDPLFWRDVMALWQVRFDAPTISNQPTINTQENRHHGKRIQ